jgi:hypothetical protein
VSAHWSGYVDVATHGRRLKSVSASFTVPSINCAKSPDPSFVNYWVGLDGWADSTIEHVGITASCSGGTADYLGFYEMSPLPAVAFTGFSPGDAVRASVTFKAPTWVLALKDMTNGALITTTQACPAGSTCRNLSAEVIAEAPETPAGTILPLADFGQVSYVNAAVTSISGSKGTLAAKTGHWRSTAVRMTGSAGAMAVPSSLEGGRAFFVTWKASG